MTLIREVERTVLHSVCNMSVTEELVAEWRDIAILRPLKKRTMVTQIMAGAQYEALTCDRAHVDYRLPQRPVGVGQMFRRIGQTTQRTNYLSPRSRS